MVIAAGGNECRLGSVTLGQFKAEHATVKVERTRQIGDFEMHMTDAGFPDRSVAGRNSADLEWMSFG
jgi:hypothetical protein